MPGSLQYTPYPTCQKFLFSEKFYNVICSNRGGGKTTSGFMRTIVQAQKVDKLYYPLKWAVIRDTRKNLGKTTAVTMKKWWPTGEAKWVGKPEEPESCTLYVNRQPLIIFDFFGVNSDADHDRFQSYEASGGVWIEEPCPARTNTEFISSGVSESVLAMAVTSLRGAPHPSVQLTMNPPSAEHWTAQLWHLPGYEALGSEEDELPEQQRQDRDAIRADSAVFMVPPSENAAESETPGYTEHNRQILSATGNSDMLARLVEGRVGYVQVGEKVTPEFAAHHLSPGLQVIPGVPFALFFDFGLNSTCIATQISPGGYWLIHKAWSLENQGMKQLLQLHVQPWLAQQGITQFWYGGGPEARQREQSDSEESALKMIIQTLGPAPYRSGPVSWSARRDAMRDALTRSPSGLPWIRINPSGAALLVRTLDGGWSYPTDPLGRIRKDAPNKKSRFDHLGDAFAAGCAVLLHKTDAQSRSVQTSRQHVTIPRHGSYSSSRTGA
jgi:hypothetical protein